MSKLITTDSDYSNWINLLVERYRSCQIRATVKAYEELLRFYWSTGEDIVKKKAEKQMGRRSYQLHQPGFDIGIARSQGTVSN